MSWYLGVLKKYATFSGRARRTEYWMFVLFNIIIGVVLEILALIPKIGILFWVILGLYGLALIIPGLAVIFRRLHDTGKSGWYILFNLIPFVGSIIFLVFLCMDSNPGDNAYGPTPKA